MIYLAWTVALAIVCAWVVFLLLRDAAKDNRYASGAEISEDDLAEAIQPDLLAFAREQNETAK